MKLTMKKNLALSLVILAMASTNANSATVVGTITRTLSSAPATFGGCMIALSKAIENGCPSIWVSLDCNGKFSSAGERNYSSALMAFSLNKTVVVYIDGVQKHNTYCVASRIDILQ